MNLKPILLGAAVIFSIPAYAADDQRVDLNQLPPQVRRTLEATADVSQVQQITRRTTTDAGTFYEIQMANNVGANPRIRIREDGEVFTDSREQYRRPETEPFQRAESVPVFPPRLDRTNNPLKIEDLPQAARRTIEKHASGREIVEINPDRSAHGEAYVVQFRDSGPNPRIYVTADGTLVTPTEKPPVLGLGKTILDTPTAVQATLRNEIGKGEVTKIDREGSGQSQTYKVEVKDERGTYQLRISNSGQVLENSRKGGGSRSK